MEEHPQKTKGEGMERGVEGDSVDDILLLPEEPNQRNAKCSGDELSKDVSLVFHKRKRERKAVEEANEVIQGETFSSSEDQEECEEDGAPLPCDDESQPAAEDPDEDELICREKRRTHKVSQEGEPQEHSKTQQKTKGSTLKTPTNGDGRQACSLTPPTVSKTESIARRTRRKTSCAYEFFEQKSSGHRICIHCGASFSPNTGLSSLKYHMENACSMAPHAKGDRFDREKADTLLCRAIIEDCLSLRFTDSPNLHAFVSYLKPGYKPPGRKMLTKSLLPKLTTAIEKVMHNKLDSIDYVSISLRSSIYSHFPILSRRNQKPKFQESQLSVKTGHLNVTCNISTCMNNLADVTIAGSYSLLSLLKCFYKPLWPEKNKPAYPKKHYPPHT